MTSRIKAYMQQIEGLFIGTIDPCDTLNGVPYTWEVTGIYRGKSFMGWFVIAGETFPTLDLIIERIEDSQS